MKERLIKTTKRVDVNCKKGLQHIRRYQLGCVTAYTGCVTHRPDFEHFLYLKNLECT